MTLADDQQNPKPSKTLAKSMDAITALREAMEHRLTEAKKNESSAAPATPESPAASPVSIPETEPSVKADEPPPGATPPHAESQAKASAQSSTQKDDKEAFSYDPAEWSRILLRIGERSQKLILEYQERNKNATGAPPAFDPSHLSEAFTELTSKLLNDPKQFVEAQIALWQGYAQIWQTTMARMQGKPVADPVQPAFSDKRFKDTEWQRNWIFDCMKQTYLHTAKQMREVVQSECQKLDPKLARKLDFVTRQMVDAVSPSNFWMTNPEVLREVYNSGGESMIKGLENLLADLESGKGDLRIRMTDNNAFKLGENLATTPGKVVYQNPLMQLIQYSPTTPDVHRVPLLILPPWINKYYILDLRAKNSFIAYLVAQGHTVFCVSWVNPDERYAEVKFDDYMTAGALTAMREIARLTGEKAVNAVGYCIGGTLLASTLAYLKGMDQPLADMPEVNSATYLVTMTDFSEPGDLGAFIEDDLIKLAEERMAKQGYLDATAMATVFNLLRANDLIWSYVVNNYLLGKDPMPFDILYWNSDSTNMPAAMQRYYIREMYKDNNLIKPNGITLNDMPIDLHKITTPSFLLSTREDHIAPWKSTYCATQVYKGPVTFTLAASGHIAGVVNPPSSNKYGYWTNSACPANPDDWLASAEEHKGSWWPEWNKWLSAYAGDRIPARVISESIEDAPGSYVKVRAV